MKITSFVLVALVGCTSSSPSSDAAAPPIDPAGTWALSDAWSTGNCGATGTSTETLTIAHGPSGETVASSAGASATGTFACNFSTCDVTISETSSGTTSGMNYTAQTHYMLSMHDRMIVGAGSVAINFASGSACTQVFNTTGTFTP